MPLSFDPVALFVASLALWLTMREIRRSNCVALKVEECSYGGKQSIDENHTQPFEQFRVLIRNRGIPLFDPQLQLSFLDEEGLGIASMTVKRRNDGGDGTAQFQRGMVAEFSIKTYELDEQDIRFLCRLTKLAKQHATLCVYSQGFLAKAIPVVSWSGRIRSLWNSVAVWFNYHPLKNKGRGVQIQQVKPTRFQIGMFPTLAFPLERFVESLRREHLSETLSEHPT